MGDPVEMQERYEAVMMRHLKEHDIFEGVVAMFNTKQAEIERLREALRKCLPVMRRAHDRIHCLPRTSDTELAGEIDITLGIVRTALEEKE